MNKGKTFSKTTIVYASKESLWEVLLSSRLYEIAWNAELRTTWEPGTNIQFNGVWEDVNYTDKGVVEVKNENRCLTYSYWSSFWNVPDVTDEYCLVSYKIDSLDTYSCKLTIGQDGFRDDKHYRDTVVLWESTIAIVKGESEKMDLMSLNDSVFERLISLVDSLSEAYYNRRAAESWSIAQVIEHIILGSSDLGKFFAESAIDSTVSYDLNIQQIRDLMLNDMVKLQTLDFLIPPSRSFDKVQHREALPKLQAEINDCISTLDLSAKCTAAELPPFGSLSIFEWLNFTVFHISRHTRQIEAIFSLDHPSRSCL